VMKGGVAMDLTDAEPIPSWPHERSRVQANDVLTRDVALGDAPASPGGLPWHEDEARDMFADIARKGRAAKVPTAEEG
jgi:hypothetical protein